ncbi:MAG: hypothetical protein COX57_01815 [Alphaproteobacteria bacterium CG_4_10_14_0_2_um_filter_63_37]|nr:MAG: hypothetical protein AUJ55_10950 [Proteobacteria bacterium CG1_02_64_396]PJA25744.1 MAG: hypothetical protein COX57_01815 [Alphaproteobacteria bacterium CG_4_10_14_0_2_um_filter_63_37]
MPFSRIDNLPEGTLDADVWVAVVSLHLPEAQSLKGRRALVHPIVERAAKAGFAAADLSKGDRWQRAELAFAAVGRPGSGLKDRLSLFVDDLSRDPRLALLDVALEER